jgi:hypothetical protein
MLLPNVGDLLPDVDSKIQLGVLQRIVEVSILSFYASSSSISSPYVLMRSRSYFDLRVGCW